jgi:hypothetical protein
LAATEIARKLQQLALDTLDKERAEMEERIEYAFCLFGFCVSRLCFVFVFLMLCFIASGDSPDSSVKHSLACPKSCIRTRRS